MRKPTLVELTEMSTRTRLAESSLRQIIRGEVRKLIKESSSSGTTPYGIPMDDLVLITSQENGPSGFLDYMRRKLMGGHYKRSAHLDPLAKEILAVTEKVTEINSVGKIGEFSRFLYLDWTRPYVKSLVGMGQGAGGLDDARGAISRIGFLAAQALGHARVADEGGTHWVSVEDAMQKHDKIVQEIHELINQVPASEIAEFCKNARLGMQIFQKLGTPGVLSDEEVERYIKFMGRSPDYLHKVAANLDALIARRQPTARSNEAMFGMDEGRRRRSRR
jgi:hypothetical protein